MTNSQKISRQHIVYVINAIKNSGPNQILNTMAMHINRDLFDVTIVSFLEIKDKKAIEMFDKLGVNHYCFNLGRKLDILIKGPRLLGELLQEIKPDIIHSHGILTDIAVRKANKNAVIVSTLHNNIFEDYSYTFGKLNGFLFSRWHVATLKRFDQVVCCSSTAREAIKGDIPAAKFVRNGVDPQYIPRDAKKIIRKALSIQEQDKVFIYIGKLSSRKNVLELLESFSDTHKQDEHLLVLGDGELRGLCDEYATDNIHILGFKNNVVDYLAVSDVYVSASRSEGLSVSIIEALNKGLYLLISDIPSHREVIEINKGEYIGELFTEENFGRAKKRLMAKKMSRAIPINYQNEHLSASVMMRGYQDLYQGYRV